MSPMFFYLQMDRPSTLSDVHLTVVLSIHHGILNTSDYRQKISSLLQDPAYRKLTKDPTDSIERKTTALLKKSSIPEERRRQMCPAGSRPPRLYGLPKIHKEEVPLRPIVSNICAPTYQLAKHLSELLNQHRKNSTPGKELIPLHQNTEIT